MENIELKINGMHCTGCSNRLEKVLKNVEGVKEARVDFEGRKAAICYNKEEVSLEEIKETIIDSGFEIEGD